MVPDSPITEEAGDADKQFLEEKFRFLRILPQIAHIVADLGDLVQPHAPFNPPGNGALLVERKILAALAAQQDDNLLQGALVLFRDFLFRPSKQWDVPEIIENFAR